MAKSVVPGSNSIDTGELQQELQQTQNLTKAIREEMAAISQEFAMQVDYAKDMAKQMVNYRSQMSRVGTISTDIKHIEESILDVNDRLGKQYVKNSRIQQLIENTKTVSSRLEAERVAAVANQQNLAANATQAQKDEAAVLLDTIKQNITANEANRIVLEEIQATLGEHNKLADTFEKKNQAIARIMNSIARIPILGQLINANRLAEEYSQSMQQGNAALKDQIKDGLKNPILLGAAAIAAWSKLIDIFKSLAKLVFAYDENITKVANTLAITKGTARGILSTFIETDRVAGNFAGILDSSFLNAKNVSKAIVDLNDQFGTSMMLSRDMIESQIALTEQMGLSSEEAAGIQKYQLLSNVNAKAVLDSVTKQNKIGISYRKIIGEIAKVNTEISAAYKNQPELLAKAAIKAAEIGMNLEDTKKIADSLLNFESSIDNELKAELLTGKQLNYEKARALALDGKSAEAAEELVKQVGGINQLTNLNVIQRKALAESIGLSSEELTKFAQQQEIVKNLGKESVASVQEEYNLLKASGREREAAALIESVRKQQNGEALAQDVMRASLNQRYEQSITKIKEVFADMLAGPITGILTSIAGLLKHTTMLKVLALGLLGVFTAITIALTAAAVAMAFATGGASALLGSLAAGVVVATVAGVAASSYTPDEYVQDAAIAPDGRISIKTPKGRIIPDKEDSIITTTNPEGLLSGGPAMNTSGLESKLDKLISVVEKGGNVYIDSNRSGTSYAMAKITYA